MLSGPQLKFVHGIVAGLNQTDAYLAAYPECSPKAAEAHGSRLVRNGKVKEEIARLRAEAEKAADGPILTLAMKRKFLHDLVTTPIGEVDKSSWLCQSVKYTEDGFELKMPDKLRAIELDSKHSGELEPEKAEIRMEVVVLKQ
jgi:hypothetical protein